MRDRILIGPGGPILDANLDTVVDTGNTGAPIAATLDVGVHWLRATGRTVTVDAIDRSTSERFARFGQLGTDTLALRDDVASASISGRPRS